ncbi:hypothetical protein N431DRAFT_456099 [Stipitochalara longipes BDJ]|nr:hypothetical protein N431DRAFT_456099 [Stipitochalara longipes BDJ]
MSRTESYCQSSRRRWRLLGNGGTSAAGTRKENKQEPKIFAVANGALTHTHTLNPTKRSESAVIVAKFSTPAKHTSTTETEHVVNLELEIKGWELHEARRFHPQHINDRHWSFFFQKSPYEPVSNFIQEENANCNGDLKLSERIEKSYLGRLLSRRDLKLLFIHLPIELLDFNVKGQTKGEFSQGNIDWTLP